MIFDEATEAYLARLLQDVGPPTDEQKEVLRRVFGGVPAPGLPVDLTSTDAA